MRAIKIDVTNKTINEIDIPTGIAAIYKELECECFTVITVSDKNDGLYIDDEGLLLDEPIGTFTMNGIAQPLSGHGLIIGCDENGESVDCTIPLELVRKAVKFVDKKMLKGVPLEMDFIPLDDKEMEDYFKSGNLPLGKAPICKN